MDKPPIERELPQDDKNSETVSISNRYHDSAFKPSLDHLSIEPLEPAFVGCSFQLEESIPPPPPTSSNAELSAKRNLNLSISVENIGQPIFTSSPVIGTQPYSTERNLSLLKDVDQHILTSSPVIEKRTNQPSGSMFTRSPVKRKLHFIEKGQNHAAHELMMNVKQLNKVKQSSPKVINLAYSPKKASGYIRVQHKKLLWVDNNIVKLSTADRAVIKSPMGWLHGDIIDAAQNILSQQFGIPGFQSVSLGPWYNFNVMLEEFIQILHNGKNHWITISTIGAKHPEVFVLTAYTIGHQILSNSRLLPYFRLMRK